MALPKKRKKLEHSNNTHSTENAVSPDLNREKKDLKKPRTKSSARKKSGEKMNKAFEIIEQIESSNGLPGSDTSADKIPESVNSAYSGHKNPGKIQFRISIDSAVTGSNINDQNTKIDYDSGHVIDFGIKIPPIIWKVPFLKKAAQKMISKLSSQD